MAVAKPIPILLVDDQEDLVEVWGAFLHRLGHDITAVRTLADAQAVLDGGLRPELAIVDWTLGEVSADPLLRSLHDGCPRCLVALTTGHGEDITEGARTRVHVVLRKPFALRELAKLAERASTESGVQYQ